MRISQLQFLAAALVGLVGCAGTKHAQLSGSQLREYAPVPVTQVQPPIAKPVLLGSTGHVQTGVGQTAASGAHERAALKEQTRRFQASRDTDVRLASSETTIPKSNSLLTTAQHLQPADALTLTPPKDPRIAVVGMAAPIAPDLEFSLQEANSPSDTVFSAETEIAEPEFIENSIQLNLPSVLAVIDGRHPIVGFARWRVQQAYAEVAQAKSLWLPSIQAGFSFHRHDGNYQASNGQIVDVNRNSFQYGLGAGGVGAGTTPVPGVVAQFQLADAIFQPKIAKSTSWARGHSAIATENQQLLQAGLAYFDLLDAHQNQRVIEETHERLKQLTKITVDFAEAGEGLQADADRLNTELVLNQSAVVAAQERIALTSARLVQTLSLEVSGTVVPMDINAVPVEMLPVANDKGALIGTALATRPELKEAQSLVAAACQAYRREKFAPFVPSVLLGFSTGGFGGGLSSNLNNIQNRYDFDAQMSWQVRNMGFGERAAKRRRSAQVEQAKFEKLRRMDEVAAQVSEALAQTEHRRRQVEITRDAIMTARNSYDRNLERIRDGQGLPIEVLQSVQALQAAETAYLRAVIGYNQAQLQLMWSLGWPVQTADA